MKLHLSTPIVCVTMFAGLVVPGGGETSRPNQPLPKGVNVKVAAKRVDRLIELDLARAKLTPNPLADDATFLRRAYVGVIGRIPTAAESLEFLNSQVPNKRSALIDTLLDSPGHDSQMFNYWADLLRVRTRLNNQVRGDPFIHYIKQSLADDKPYDEFVKDMIKAEGAAHQRGNGATGLLMRDRGMPLDSMANTVRVFLGTRLECAQCHDHPFDKWKQKDFYGMAAFTGGLSYRQNLQSLPGTSSVRQVVNEMRQKKDRNGQRALGRMMRSVYTGLSGTGTGLIRLPKDYKYDDAKPRSIVKAHALFGESPKVKYPDPKKGKKKRPSWRERQAERRRKMRKGRRRGNQLRAPELNTRAAYADWLASKKNPRFTKVIANRMWKLVMGRGLIEPVDNLMDDTKASNPALMRYLEKLMVDVDYDIDEYLRVLFNTATFQRQATRSEVPDDQKYYYQGPVLRRMTAEQVWDSMLTFVVPNVDAKLHKPGVRADFTYDEYDRLVNMTPQELRQEVDKQKLRFTNPKKFREMRQKQRRRMYAKRRSQQQKQADRMREKIRPLYKELSKARRARDAKLVAEIAARLRQLGVNVDDRGRRKPNKNRGRRNNRGRLVFARASDLQHPAPNGHFVRQFGQSDRDQIQASHTEANVPQVLSLLNGFVEKQVLSSDSAELMKSIHDAPSDKDKVRMAYLGILNREPRGRELAIWENDLQKEGLEIVNDLVWTLVNSHEFRFVQ